MTLISKDENRLNVALEIAEETFWEAVRKEYPEVTTGDLSPHQAILLAGAMRSVVVKWLELNADETEPNTVEILLHNIEYNYTDFPNADMTDDDAQHIAHSISKGISEGELLFGGGGGYWKINNNPNV